MSDTNNQLVLNEPTPRAQAHLMQISERSGAIAYATMADVVESAKLMSQAGLAVRKHFRGNPGACMAVVQQAIRWGMDPYAVANKSYHVNDQLAFESGLIQAAITLNAPIKGRIKTEYLGEGFERQIKVWARLKPEPGEEDEGEIVTYTSPLFKDITPKNSPLWKTDPDQQLHYWGVRAFSRRHFPEVLLGVQEKEEAEAGYEDADYKIVETQQAPQTMADRLDQIAAGGAKRKPRGWPAAFEAASLVIEEGVVTKSRTGEVGGAATQEDHAEADLLLIDGKMVIPARVPAKREEAKPAEPEAPKKAAEMPDIPENLDRRERKAEPETKPAPEAKPEPIKVTSGAAKPLAAAAAASLDDDPFADADEDQATDDPVEAAVKAFRAVAPTISSIAAFEDERRKLLAVIKPLDKDSPVRAKASLAFNEEKAAFEERLKKASAPAQDDPGPSPDGQGEGMTAEEEDELERIMTHELDHSPRGIDTGDLTQVKAYVAGVKAAEKGRAITAVPTVYEDAEAKAWETGHAYRTANPASSQEG